MKKDNETLHLVLKRKWWDMISSGEKKEEYREVCHYWSVRLLDEKWNWYFKHLTFPVDLGSCLRWLFMQQYISFKNFKRVCFHLGYTNVTMTFKILSFSINVGKSKWGAELNKEYFVIKLGERIE